MMCGEVQAGRVCRLNLFMQGKCFTSDEADAIDLELHEHFREQCRSGWRRHTALHLVIRLQGPLPYIVINPDKFSNHHPLGIGHNYIR